MGVIRIGDPWLVTNTDLETETELRGFRYWVTDTVLEMELHIGAVAEKEMRTNEDEDEDQDRRSRKETEETGRHSGELRRSSQTMEETNYRP